MAKNKHFEGWKGVDTRSTLDSADPKTLRAAINVDLITDGTIVERDGLRLVAQLDSDSVGLYSVGGRLRACMAAGHSKAASVQSTVPITYDFVGDGTVYALASVERVTSVSNWDADSAQGLYPVIVIQRSAATGGQYEIHWIKDQPAPTAQVGPPPFIPSNDPVTTKLSLPFLPGDTILKIQEKMCAIDNANGAVWFCATVDRPDPASTTGAMIYAITNWTQEGDAGFLPVIRHCTGDRTIKGLSFYDDLMAVLFEDSIQLWQMNPAPAQMGLVRVLAGPGVKYPGSVANVRGDLIYFSSGTFSSLRRSEINGQLRDGDIGAPIFPSTKTLQDTRPIGLWSQSRSAYYCFFGTEAWRYMASPTSKKTGWTKYELPDGISADYVVEHLGQLYIRSGDNVYRFEEGYVDGSTYTVDTHYLDCDLPSEWKFVRTMDFSGEGTPVIWFFPDMRQPTLKDRICQLDGSTASMDKIAILENSEAFSLRLTGAVGSGFSLDRLSFALGDF